MSDSIKTPPRLALKAQHHPTHHFDHLSRRICQEEWIFQAFTAVLSTQAAQTAGIAGVTKKALTSDEAHLALVRELQRDLRQGRFRPVPLRRIDLPKSNGKMRPRGMPTLQDRVVHMLLQMRVEPSGESACLKCCHGFRPGRKTMACIAALDSYSTTRTKFDCVIAGESKGAFAYVQHDILLKGLAERIADRRLLKLLARFRKAGLMEQGLLHHTELGVAQGGSCSPFLANIDLPPLERSWWEN